MMTTTYQDTIPTQLNLKPKHLAELKASCISDEILSLNFQSIEDEDAIALVLQNQDGLRRNDGRLRDFALRIAEAVSPGGWSCQGIDLTTMERHHWGQMKADVPRKGGDGKLRKYESPRKVKNGIYALQVGAETIAEINRIGGYGIPENCDNIWEWVVSHPEVPIVLTEGGKKGGAALSAGHIAIALTGCNGGYHTDQDKRRTLHPELEVLCQPGRKFIFALDEDTKPKTRRTVRKAANQTAKLLKRKGCKSYLAHWDRRYGKGVDDLIANRGANAFLAAVETARPLDLVPYSQLTLERDLELNERYLPSFPIPDSNRLIGIKSPKGTGKTQWLSQAIAPYVGKRKILVISHRVQLCAALSQRLGVPTTAQIERDPSLKDIGQVLCFDSMHEKSQAQFNPAEMGDAIVLMDECEQSLWHLLSSTTEVKIHRPEVIDNLRYILTHAHKVIGLDADLSDVSLNYISSLMGGDRPYVVENDYQFEEPWQVYRYEGKDPEGVVHAAIEHIREGGKPFICLGAQKEQSKWGTTNIEAQVKKEFPELRVLRIDSDTLSLEDHPAYGCLGNLDTIVKDYDVVIASPSVETGVSIDVQGHFTAVFGAYYGNVTPDSIRQALSRVREPIDRHLWVADTALHSGFIGSGASYHKDLIEDGLYAARIKRTLLGSANADLKALFGVLADADTAAQLDHDYAPQSVKTWAMMAARINHGFSRYADSTFEGLEREGHNIERVTPGDSDGFKDDVKATRDENYHQHNVDVSESSDISLEELQTLERQRSFKNKAQKNQVKRETVSQIYGGIDVTPELLVKHDNGWLPQIKLDFYYRHGEYRDFIAWRKHSKDIERGGYYTPDFNAAQKPLAACEVLRQLDLDYLLNTEGLSNRDPRLIELCDFAIKYRKDLKLLLGVTFKENTSPIEFAKKVLEKVGHKIAAVKTANTQGKRFKVYSKAAHDFERDSDGKVVKTNGQVTPVWDNRDEVFERWGGDIEIRMLDAKAAASEATEQVVEVKTTEQPAEPVAVQLSIDDAPQPLVSEAIVSEPAKPVKVSGDPVMQPDPQPTQKYQPGDRVWAWFENQWHEATIRAKSWGGWLLEGCYAAWPDEWVEPFYTG